MLRLTMWPSVFFIYISCLTALGGLKYPKDDATNNMATTKRPRIRIVTSGQFMTAKDQEKNAKLNLES